MLASTAKQIGVSVAWGDRKIWCARLGKASDVCLLLLLFGAPLVLGGRHPAGRLVFVTLSLLAAVLYCARQALSPQRSVRWHVSFWIPVAALVCVVLQMIPLPLELITLLAPHRSALLADAGQSQSGWSAASLLQRETTTSLMVLLGYASLYWLVVQRLRTREDLWTALKLVAAAGAFMAFIGIAQKFTAGGRFLWVYDHPFRSAGDVVKGAFANRNHFASFLATAVGPLVVWLLVVIQRQATAPSNNRNDRQWLEVPLLITALATVVVASLMSASRGGVLVMALAIGVMLAWLATKRLLGWQTLGGMAIAGSLIAIVGLLSAGEQVESRLGDLATGSVEQLDRAGLRRMIWMANVEAIATGGVMGSGAGTHRAIHAAYLTGPTPKAFSHAENSYLQVASETGWLGIALLAAALCGLVGALLKLFQRAQQRDDVLLAAALASGLAVSLVHSLFDFVWYIPACMTLTLVLLAALVRFVSIAQIGEASPPSAKPTNHASRSEWTQYAIGFGLALAVATSALLPAARAAGSWDEYLRIAVRLDRLEQAEASGQPMGEPEAVSEYRQYLSGEMVNHLQQVLLVDPSDDTARLRLSQALLREFERRRQVGENRQNIVQIATTCRDAGFADRESTVEWLKRAFGGDATLLESARRHALLTTQLSPADADGWLVLARLSFLDPAAGDSQAILNTALRLAPHDGRVLFELGRSRLLAGDSAGAVEAWQACFAVPGPHRLQVVEIYAGFAPVAEFVDTFQPDWSTLDATWEMYKARGTRQQLLELLEYAVRMTDNIDAANSSLRPVFAWGRLGRMYADLGDHDRAVQVLERAMEHDANNFGVRLKLAGVLMHLERYHEAEQHYRWCLARRPEMTAIRKQITKATSLGMKHLRTATPTLPTDLL